MQQSSLFLPTEDVFCCWFPGLGAVWPMSLTLSLNKEEMCEMTLHMVGSNFTTVISFHDGRWELPFINSVKMVMEDTVSSLLWLLPSVKCAILHQMTPISHRISAGVCFFCSFAMSGFEPGAK